jgi:putative peptidoglycan lipid II flippase
MSENVRVAKAAGIVGSATLASRIMGYIRDMVMSWAFGTTALADAFYVAYRIPNLLRELLAEGSMSAAFIPVFTETLTKGTREEAKQLANAVFARLLIILVVITSAGILFAPLIVKAIAPGWTGSAQGDEIRIGVILTRIMFPYLLFIGLAALAMGMLNSLRSFLMPALSPVMLNVMIIASVLIAAPFMPSPIMGAAIGVLLGGICQFLIQVPGLRRQGMMPVPRFSPSHPGVPRIGRLAVPILISSSVTQVNIFIGTILASFLPTGSISYLYYAMRFIQFPLGIFGVSVATAVLPTLSTQAARGEMKEFRETVSQGLRLVFFIMFPAIAGIISFRVPIVNVLLEHGEFNRVSTLGTAAALMYYAVGLWAFAGVRIISQAFYSLQDTKTPVAIAILALFTNIALSVFFVFRTPLAHAGLALATSVAAMVNVGLLTMQLRKKIGRIDAKRILRSLLKIIPASLAMSIIGVWVSTSTVWDHRGNTLYKLELLGGGIAASLCFYIAAMRLMKSEELSFIWTTIRRKRVGAAEITNGELGG